MHLLSHDRQRLLALCRSVIASAVVTAMLVSPPIAKADAVVLFVASVLHKPVVEESSGSSDIVQEHRTAAQQFIDCCLISSPVSRKFETGAEDTGDLRTASDRFRNDVLQAGKR